MRITPRTIKLILHPIKRGKDHWDKDFVRDIFAPLKKESLGGDEVPESVLDSYGTQLTSRLSEFMRGKVSYNILKEWAYEFQFGKVYQKMIKTISEYLNDKGLNEKQRKELIDNFNEDKQKMPNELAHKIETKLNRNQDYEAILLLLLWSIYWGNMELIQFLFPADAASQPLSEYEMTIEKTNAQSEISVNIFNFRNPKIRFRGRKSELHALNIWLSREGVSVWAVTGQGGCGKSKLALHLTQQCSSECKAVWLDKELLSELNKFNDFRCSREVLFICDYAAQYEKELPNLIDKMRRTKTNAKFLLIERANEWYKDFLKTNDAVKECAYSEFPINLEAAELSEDDYALIIQDLSDAQYNGKEITSDARIQIIQRAEELSESSDTIRCLFLLLVADAYFRSGDIRYLDASTLLHNYIQHSRNIIRDLYGEEITRKGFRILAYATACSGIEWDEEHPAIQEDLRWIIEKIDVRDQINILFNQLSEQNEQDAISALKPDLIGEYLFLFEWNNLPTKKNQNKWLYSLLQMEYGRMFLAMCMADWHNEATCLCEMLTDTTAFSTSFERGMCAAVLMNAWHQTHISHFDKRRSEVFFHYFYLIENLGVDSSAYVLDYYVQMLLSFSSVIGDFCITKLNSIRIEQYICESQDEKKCLIDALMDMVFLYYLQIGADNNEKNRNILKCYNSALSYADNDGDRAYIMFYVAELAISNRNKAAVGIIEKSIMMLPNEAKFFLNTAVISELDDDNYFGTWLAYVHKVLLIVTGRSTFYNFERYKDAAKWMQTMTLEECCAATTATLSGFVCQQYKCFDSAVECFERARTLFPNDCKLVTKGLDVRIEECQNMRRHKEVF